MSALVCQPYGLFVVLDEGEGEESRGVGSALGLRIGYGLTQNPNKANAHLEVCRSRVATQKGPVKDGQNQERG